MQFQLDIETVSFPNSTAWRDAECHYLLQGSSVQAATRLRNCCVLIIRGDIILLRQPSGITIRRRGRMQAGKFDIAIQ